MSRTTGGSPVHFIVVDLNSVGVTVTDSSFIGHSNEKQSCSDPFMISICLHVMTFRKGVDVCVFRCCLAARQRRMALDIVSATPVRHPHTVDAIACTHP